MHIAPPDKVRETNYDELLSFQIIFNAFHTIYALAILSARSLCAWESTVPETEPRRRWFQLSHDGKGRYRPQQFGFDFTGGGGVTRVALHRPSLASRTCSLSLTEVTPSTLSPLSLPLRPEPGFQRNRSGHDFLIGFDRDIGALDVVMIHSAAFTFAVMALSSMKLPTLS